VTIEAKDLLDGAMRLPASDRAELADLLIDSLDDGSDADAQEAWSDEIARRLAELDSGAVKTVPWAEVRRRMTQDAQ
jgi:putative addiction module component (TIGR02574 family)